MSLKDKVNYQGKLGLGGTTPPVSDDQDSRLAWMGNLCAIQDFRLVPHALGRIDSRAHCLSIVRIGVAGCYNPSNHRTLFMQGTRNDRFHLVVHAGQWWTLDSSIE